MSLRLDPRNALLPRCCDRPVLLLILPCSFLQAPLDLQGRCRCNIVEVSADFHPLCVATIWSRSINRDVSAEMLSRVFRFSIISMLLAFTMNSEISTRAIERLRRLCRSLQVTIQLLSGSISVIIDDTAGLLSRARRHFHS